MTFFLDGPPPPTRSADKIPSKAPLAAPVTGARQAPDPSGMTGIPVAPKKPAPTVERQRKNTRLAALRAAALRAEARREEEVEEVVTAAATTDETEPDTDETTAAATEEPAEPAEETEMAANGGTERIREALKAAAPRTVSLDELETIYGGPRTAARTRINQMVRSGEVKKLDGQMYRWAGALEPRPAKARQAPPPPEEDAADDGREDDDHTVVADGFGNDEDDEEPAADDTEDGEEPGAPKEDPAEEPGQEVPTRPRPDGEKLMDEVTRRFDEAQRLLGLALSHLVLSRHALRRMPTALKGDAMNSLDAAAMYCDSASRSVRTAARGFGVVKAS